MGVVYLDGKIPLYNAYGELIGEIPIAQARELEGSFLELRTKGNGRRRRLTSAKLYAREDRDWIPTPSAGYTVLQLVDKARSRRK